MDSDTKMAEGAAPGAPQSRLLDPAIFDFLKSKIDEEQQVRDDLTQIVQKLERATSFAQGLLSRVHGTPRSQCEKRPFALIPMLLLRRDADPVRQIPRLWPRLRRASRTRSQPSQS